MKQTTYLVEFRVDIVVRIWNEGVHILVSLLEAPEQFTGQVEIKSKRWGRKGAIESKQILIETKQNQIDKLNKQKFDKIDK
jgi:hypothetical protein